MVALPRLSIPSGKPELASQAAVSELTNVVPCVTARCACNRHPARDGDRDDARLPCCCRNGFWSGRRVGSFGAHRYVLLGEMRGQRGCMWSKACGAVSLGAEPFTRPGPVVERPRSSAPRPATSGTAPPCCLTATDRGVAAGRTGFSEMGMKAPAALCRSSARRRAISLGVAGRVESGPSSSSSLRTSGLLRR